MPTSARMAPCARQSDRRFGRRAACPHAAMPVPRCLRTLWFRQPALAGCGHPALRAGPNVRRRGGYQPPDQASGSRRTPAKRRRAACPHAAMPVPRCLRTLWFRQPALAGCGHPALRAGPNVRRRGGYQPPDQASGSRRTPAKRRRAACPHAASRVLGFPSPGGV